MKLQYKYIIIPIIINAIFGFFWLLMRFFMPIYLKEDLGFSGGQIGFLYALFSIAGIIFIVPAGLGTDRYTPKKIMQIFSLGMVASALLIAFFKDFWILTIVFFVYGLSKNATNIALSTEVFKNAEQNEVGKIFGKYNFAGAFAAGLGMISGGIIIQQLSFRIGFILQAFGFFCGFLLSSKFSKLPTIKIELLSHLKDFFRVKVLVFSGVLFLFAMHWGAEDVAYGLFLKHNLLLNEKQMGFYMASETFFLAFSALFFGYKIHRKQISFKNILYIGLILSGLTHILMTTPVFWFSFLMRSIHGIGDGAMSIVLFLGIKKLFHIDRIGGSGSLVILATMFGAFFGSLIFGFISNAGYQWPLIISGIISLSLVIVIYLWQQLFDH